MKSLKLSRMAMVMSAVFLVANFVLMLGMPIVPALAEEGKVYTGRLSYHWFPKHHSAIFSEKFVNYCKEATKGRLKITTYPSGELYGIRSALGAVSQGAVDMVGIVDVIFVAVDPNFSISSMTYVFDNYKQLRDLWETKAGKKVMQALQKRLNVKLLCSVPVGPSYIWTTNKPLPDLKSHKGQKTRFLSVAEKPAYDAMGMSSVSVATAEIYSAAQQRMINTMSTVPSAIKAYSWWDFFKYVTHPPQAYIDAYLVANGKWFNRLPKDIQDTVLQVGRRITEESTASILAFGEKIFKEFEEKHGGTVTKLTPENYRELLTFYKQKVYPKLTKRIDPDLVKAAEKVTGKTID